MDTDREDYQSYMWDKVECCVNFLALLASTTKDLWWWIWYGCELENEEHHLNLTWVLLYQLQKMSNRKSWKRAQIKVGGFGHNVESAAATMTWIWCRTHPHNLRPKAKLWTEPNGGYVVRCWGIAKFGVRGWKIARQGWWRLLCFGVPIAADKLGGLRRPWCRL